MPTRALPILFVTCLLANNVLSQTNAATTDGNSVTTTTYDGRPLTEAETCAFKMADWIPEE
jgi:hypothetical protein